MDKVGPVQDPEQPPPHLQNLTFPVCSSSVQTKDFHLVSGVSEMLQRPIRMSPSPPTHLFLVERNQKAERSGALKQEKPRRA